MDARTLAEWLHERLERVGVDGEEVARVQTFEDVGIHSSCPGIQIEMTSGEVFEVTVAQLRCRAYARPVVSEAAER
jgi:hypothetical protein